jgi:hypothetical protein
MAERSLGFISIFLMRGEARCGAFPTLPLKMAVFALFGALG